MSLRGAQEWKTSRRVYDGSVARLANFNVLVFLFAFIPFEENILVRRVPQGVLSRESRLEFGRRLEAIMYPKVHYLVRTDTMVCAA